MTMLGTVWPPRVTSSCIVMCVTGPLESIAASARSRTLPLPPPPRSHGEARTRTKIAAAASDTATIARRGRRGRGACCVSATASAMASSSGSSPRRSRTSRSCTLMARYPFAQVGAQLLERAHESHLGRRFGEADLGADLCERQAPDELEQDDPRLPARKLGESLSERTGDGLIVRRAPRREQRGEATLADAAPGLVGEPAPGDRVEPHQHGRVARTLLGQRRGGRGEDVLGQLLGAARIAQASAEIPVDVPVVASKGAFGGSVHTLFLAQKPRK